MKFNRHTIPNAWSALRRFLRALFDQQPAIASMGVVGRRREKCGQCEFNVDGQCERCTCVIALKTMIATESCPIGNWYKETKLSSGL